MRKYRWLHIVKYMVFTLLFVLNVANIYFFLLRAWNSRDMLYYTDLNFKGNFDLPEFFFGYVSGWLIIFMLSLFYGIINISKRPVKAFLWQILPFCIYNAAFFAYQLSYHIDV